jgi:cytochrome bd ubiquinol oxidase subunit I
MGTLATARSLMAMSLAFHIVFAVIGVAMPVLMVVSEGLWLRTGDPVYLDLTKRWARGTAVCFAVGAVSGTVLSFELGLLWPWFMAYAGAIIGMPFSLEGFAFFLEAIFLGIYLYGWQRVRPTTHLLSGVVVALSGALSGIFVVSANAWMNTPSGFRVVNGTPTDIDPLRAMMNPAAAAETLHMLVAAYAALGFAVAGIHARMLLSKSRSAFHSRALIVALLVGAPAAVVQPFAGDFAARVVARTQPAKLAAMEGQFETRRGAPLHIGGWPDPDSSTTRFALEIPGGLSWLAYGDRHALVSGLEEVPRADWPPVRIVHVAFQIMVAIGVLLAVLGIWAAGLTISRRAFGQAPTFLRALVAATPMGFIAIEAGWVVTEVGRQPWIIAKFMRTSEAVTSVPSLTASFAAFAILYVLLAAVVAVVLRRHVIAAPA